MALEYSYTSMELRANSFVFYYKLIDEIESNKGGQNFTLPV